MTIDETRSDGPAGEVDDVMALAVREWIRDTFPDPDRSLIHEDMMARSLLSRIDDIQTRQPSKQTGEPSMTISDITKRLHELQTPFHLIMAFLLKARDEGLPPPAKVTTKVGDFDSEDDLAKADAYLSASWSVPGRKTSFVASVSDTDGALTWASYTEASRHGGEGSVDSVVVALREWLAANPPSAKAEPPEIDSKWRDVACGAVVVVVGRQKVMKHDAGEWERWEPGVEVVPDEFVRRPGTGRVYALRRFLERFEPA